MNVSLFLFLNIQYSIFNIQTNVHTACSVTIYYILYIMLILRKQLHDYRSHILWILQGITVPCSLPRPGIALYREVVDTLWIPIHKELA